MFVSNFFRKLFHGRMGVVGRCVIRTQLRLYDSVRKAVKDGSGTKKNEKLMHVGD